MTRIGDSAVGSFDHGLAVVGTTAVRLASSPVACARGVWLKAHSQNTGLVHLGNSDVTANGTLATDGFPLAAGAELFFPISDASRVWLRSDGAADEWIYFLVM